MKSIIVICCFLLIIAGCKKENNEDGPATYIIKSYDSLVVKSYDSIVWYFPPYVDPYCRYYPEANHVSFPIDIDQDYKSDFNLEISHYLYSQSPHAEFNVVNVTLESLDTNYNIAESDNLDWDDIIDFKVGDTISSGSIYREDGYLVRTGPYVENYILTGNIHIGFRKGFDPSSYRYGYLNLVVDGAKLKLIKSVLNLNKDNCIVQE
jgi:hypothetical protein